MSIVTQPIYSAWSVADTTEELVLAKVIVCEGVKALCVVSERMRVCVCVGVSVCVSMYACACVCELRRRTEHV